ncbi:MAG: 50S ribosomal protein L32e [Methanoregula sp.]|jgi:large subunit ribosomal protein L32e
MATEVKRLIQVRTDKGARFKRDGYGKKRQLSDSWRKPRGQHNKQREQKKAKGALPKPGFGSPIAVRGMHPSGFFEVLVTSLKDLEGLDPKTQAVRLGATVGTRKRTIIQEQAVSAGLKVLNTRVVKSTKAKPATVKPAKKDEDKAEKKAAAKSKAAAPVKKAVKKAASKPKAEKPEEKADKKAPAKKAASKPKAEKPEEKADKKAPAKKAVSKPTADKTAEAKPKAAAKPKAKPAKSGVKKNE